MTKEQAIQLAATEWWKGKPAKDVAAFQLNEGKLCMPFSEFHKAVEEALGRPVYTHEFGMNFDGLKSELLGEKKAPTFDDILALIPPEKLVLISV